MKEKLLGMAHSRGQIVAPLKGLSATVKSTLFFFITVNSTLKREYLCDKERGSSGGWEGQEH